MMKLYDSWSIVFQLFNTLLSFISCPHSRQIRAMHTFNQSEHTLVSARPITVGSSPIKLYPTLEGLYHLFIVKRLAVTERLVCLCLVNTQLHNSSLSLGPVFGLDRVFISQRFFVCLMFDVCLFDVCKVWQNCPQLQSGIMMASVNRIDSNFFVWLRVGLLYVGDNMPPKNFGPCCHPHRGDPHGVTQKKLSRFS